MSSVIFLYSVCTDMKLGNSTKLYCLVTGMDHEIDFCCYPLITGKLGLPAYDLPCCALQSRLFLVQPNYVSRLPCINSQMCCAFPQLQQV